MYLRVMAQRFEMPDTLDGICNCLAVGNASAVDGDLKTKTLRGQRFQYFNLHLPHELGVNFAQTLIPNDAKLRFFLLQFAELGKHRAHVRTCGQTDAVGHHGRKQGAFALRLRAETVACKQGGKPCDRADRSRLGNLRLRVVRARVKPNLCDLLLQACAAARGIGNGHPHAETAARDLQKSQAVSLRVAGDLIHPCGKFVRIIRFFGKTLQCGEQRVHAV